MISFFKKIFGGKKKQQTLAEFLKSSPEEKKKVLGEIAQQVNEDQRKILRKAGYDF